MTGPDWFGTVQLSDLNTPTSKIEMIEFTVLVLASIVVAFLLICAAGSLLMVFDDAFVILGQSLIEWSGPPSD